MSCSLVAPFVYASLVGVEYGEGCVEGAGFIGEALGFRDPERLSVDMDFGIADEEDDSGAGTLSADTDFGIKDEEDDSGTCTLSVDTDFGMEESGECVSE